PVPGRAHNVRREDCHNRGANADHEAVKSLKSLGSMPANSTVPPAQGRGVGRAIRSNKLRTTKRQNEAKKAHREMLSQDSTEASLTSIASKYSQPNTEPATAPVRTVLIQLSNHRVTSPGFLYGVCG